MRGLCLLLPALLLPAIAAAQDAEPLPPPPLYAGPPPPPAFRPAWAPTAALLLAVGFHTHVSYGAELGARRWLNRYLLAAALLQYERLAWDRWPGQPDDAAQRGHGLALLTRLELTRWDPEVRRHVNMPDGSLYPLAGLVAAFGPGGGPGVGYRVGGGFTALHYSGALAFPITCQAYYQDLRFPAARAHGGVITIGLAM